MPENPAITVRQLRFRWRRDQPEVLHIPGLEVMGGERIFIRGPNGSRKSTLLSLLAGINRPTTGEVRVLGTSGRHQWGFLQTLSLWAQASSLDAQVAKKLRYRIGQKIIIAHGAGMTSFALHDGKPFTVVGILEPTGTPVDRSVHVPLEGIEAIHKDWVNGRHVPGMKISAEQALKMDLTPKLITAFLVGLKSRIATFRVQREINEYRREPLSAILPGVALQQLWDLMAIAEHALLVVTALVVVVGLVGMLTVMLAGLNERRREMAILRSVGARPAHVLLLMVGESLLLSLVGIVLGLLLLYSALAIARPYVESQYGLYLPLEMPSSREWIMLGLVAAAGLLVGLIPGYRAYRYSLADGMSIRI